MNELVYIIPVVAVISLILYSNVRLKKKKMSTVIKALEAQLKEKELAYTIKLVDKKSYQLELVIGNRLYLVKVLTIPTHSKLVITNKTTWIINSKGQSIDLKNRIPSMEQFINETPKNSDKKVKKLVLMYPGERKVLQYINECEMIFITPNIDVFGCKVVAYDQLSKLNLNTHN